MGKDHINSSDNGKGADIFNDVPGMVEKAIRSIERGIRDIEEHNRGYSGIERMDVSGFETTRIKINHLRSTVASFNERRENRTFRTADGGSGDPDNAGKFSLFSRDMVAEIDRLCKVSSWDDTHKLNGMKNADWKGVAKMRQFRNTAYVEERTFDRMAYQARRASLQAGDRKLVSGFDKWYEESRVLLIGTFEELTDVIESFHDNKSALLRKRRREVVLPKLPKPFNNGYERPKEEKTAKPKAGKP